MKKELDIVNNILLNCKKVVLGKDEEMTNILKGIISEGNVLIEDVPGVGKTTIVKAIAKSFNLDYSRIQFTPDIMPSDVTGISVYNQKTMEFEFKKGPVFCNILLADEINRTSPRTQASLLEAMEEGQVSDGNTTYKIEKPFCVLATQNPIEQDGTFLLPEAQLDRFIIKVNIGYPEKVHEMEIMKLYKDKEPLKSMIPVATREDILFLQEQVKGIFAADELMAYILDIVNLTRNNQNISIGVSTRGALALLRISQAEALIDGRSYIIPEDIRKNACMVLAHRIRLSYEAKINNYTANEIIKNILNSIPVPRLRRC
ncbi:AAA family ATPase [Clostridium hydrogenum]|uniref:AAA family ATPase n=1 Tax=Clostridium hydrogenum TaxID=2855764 RepID=UPI001F32415D|nr:MoxR family ATPase [Clostridium hydrogenum]